MLGLWRLWSLKQSVTCSVSVSFGISLTAAQTNGSLLSCGSYNCKRRMQPGVKKPTHQAETAALLLNLCLCTYVVQTTGYGVPILILASSKYNSIVVLFQFVLLIFYVCFISHGFFSFPPWFWCSFWFGKKRIEDLYHICIVRQDILLYAECTWIGSHHRLTLLSAHRHLPQTALFNKEQVAWTFYKATHH